MIRGDVREDLRLFRFPRGVGRHAPGRHPGIAGPVLLSGRRSGRSGTGAKGLPGPGHPRRPGQLRPVLPPAADPLLHGGRRDHQYAEVFRYAYDPPQDGYAFPDGRTF